jgi:Co/Zn/Cd efflux system component
MTHAHSHTAEAARLTTRRLALALGLTQAMRALSAHILTDDALISAGAVIQRDINELLSHKYGIAHAALQLECAGCEPDVLYCNLEPATSTLPEAAI